MAKAFQSLYFNLVVCVLLITAGLKLFAFITIANQPPFLGIEGRTFALLAATAELAASIFLYTRAKKPRNESAWMAGGATALLLFHLAIDAKYNVPCPCLGRLFQNQVILQQATVHGILLFIAIGGVVSTVLLRQEEESVGDCGKTNNGPV